jgi:hypothetical protein
MVLFYVYPLKFMFDSMFAQILRWESRSIVPMSLPELARASSVYALGFVLLFLLFAMLYRHAYSKRHELDLSRIEVFDVKMFAGHHLVSAAVGVIALLVALAGPLRLAFLSPMCFGLMGPAHFAFGVLAARRRRALEPAAGTRAPV